jgi:hypothetical protein
VAIDGGGGGDQLAAHVVARGESGEGLFEQRLRARGFFVHDGIGFAQREPRLRFADFRRHRRQPLGERLPAPFGEHRAAGVQRQADERRPRLRLDIERGRGIEIAAFDELTRGAIERRTPFFRRQPAPALGEQELAEQSVELVHRLGTNAAAVGEEVPAVDVVQDQRRFRVAGYGFRIRGDTEGNSAERSNTR